jgi:hypothetical protein
VKSKRKGRENEEIERKKWRKEEERKRKINDRKNIKWKKERKIEKREGRNKKERMKGR